MPPWFYESRFLRPRVMRQAFLGALRRASVAPELAGAETAANHGTTRRSACHTLVVGGGLAGLEAAAELARCGREVLVLDASSVGGSAGWIPSLRPRVDVLRTQLMEAKARVLEGATALGFYQEEEIMAAIDHQGPIEIEFEELVVATGAYDRLLTYRGNDLPGTIGMRAFETYAAQGGLANAVIGVFAAPDEALRIASVAAESGIQLAWMAGPAELPATPCPRFPDTSLAEAGDAGRVRWVGLAGVGRKACSVLVIGFSQPTYELQIQAGLTPLIEGLPAVIRTTGTARMPTLVVGEAAGYVDPSLAGDHGRDAARAWCAAGPDPATPLARRFEVSSKDSADAFICLCEDVKLADVEAAISHGFVDIELVKRRTGIGTGACQGKLCIGQLAGILSTRGLPPRLPTQRPPLRPIPLGAMAVE
jgi:methylglutamate dehydrogenase subunit C